MTDVLQFSLFDIEPKVIRQTRPVHPLRLQYRFPPQQIAEETKDQFVRVCPICFSRLFWIVQEKLLRIDEDPEGGADADRDSSVGAEWIAERHAWGIPRYGEFWTPHCQIHGERDIWLVFDQQKGWLVGRAEIDKGGGLFKYPLRTSRRMEHRIALGRPSPFPGKFARNKRKRANVQEGMQAWIQSQEVAR